MTKTNALKLASAFCIATAAFLIITGQPGKTQAVAPALFYSGMEESTFADWGFRDTEWHQIASDHFCENKSAAIKNNAENADIVTPAIDTTGYSNLILSFKYRVFDDLEMTDTVKVQWSGDNGVHWNDLHVYSNKSASNWKSASFTLPAAAENKTNLKIRFRANLQGCCGHKDEFRLDCVSLAGTATTVCTDKDGDGYNIEGGSCGPVDCNDSNAAVNPGATEACNGIDDNCSDTIDEGVKNTYFQDADNDSYGNADFATQACSKPDGYVENDDDCNDSNAVVNPGAIETCNGIDDNCNGNIDEGEVCSSSNYYCDGDSDGFLGAVPAGNCSTFGCVPAGCSTAQGNDCDDDNDDINPQATEICDSIDNNCNGDIDEGVKIAFYLDSDKDGYGAGESAVYACSAPASHVTNNSDCNDDNGEVNPGANEICDGNDNDCDGSVDEGELWANLGQSCSTGIGICAASGTYVCNAQNPLAAAVCSAVAGTPQTHNCSNGLDNDCNGIIDSQDDCCPGPVDEPVCGNETKEEGEQCDDGNTAGGDGCSATCQIEQINTETICGNKIKETGEECDGTAGVGDHQSCSESCKLVKLAFCGDGVVNKGEQCDSTAGCTETCVFRFVETGHSGDWAPGFGPNVGAIGAGRVLGASTISLEEIEDTINEIKGKVSDIAGQVAALKGPGKVLGMATEVITGVLGF